MRHKFFLFIYSVLFIVSNNSSALEEKALIKSRAYRPFFETRKIRHIELPKGYHEGLFLNSGEILVCNGENINIWGVDLRDGEVKYEIEPSGKFTESISKLSDGKFIISDWAERILYSATIKDGKADKESEIFRSDGHLAGCLAVEGSIYFIQWERGVSGTKYNLIKASEKGEILEKIRIGHIPEPSQLCWDGKSLWITSWFDRHVYKINLNTYQIEGYFSSKLEKTTGIAWDGKYFWITGTHEDLYQVEVRIPEKKKAAKKWKPIKL